MNLKMQEIYYNNVKGNEGQSYSQSLASSYRLSLSNTKIGHIYCYIIMLFSSSLVKTVFMYRSLKNYLKSLFLKFVWPSYSHKAKSS